MIAIDQKKLYTATNSEQVVTNALIPYLDYAVVSHLNAITESTHLVQKADLVNIQVRYGNNPDGLPALLYAIKLNDFNAVKILLENGASPQTGISRDKRDIRIEEGAPQ